jgi:Flp pilus assembly pilin Flp
MNTFFEDESGATAIEYGAISSVMFALIVTAWGTAFYKIADAFNVLVTAITLT